MDESGPAFPIVAGNIVEVLGISKREYFAAKAMQGWLSSFNDTDAVNIDKLCVFCYDIADCMIEKLN